MVKEIGHLVLTKKDMLNEMKKMMIEIKNLKAQMVHLQNQIDVMKSTKKYSKNSVMRQLQEI